MALCWTIVRQASEKGCHNLPGIYKALGLIYRLGCLSHKPKVSGAVVGGTYMQTLVCA